MDFLVGPPEFDSFDVIWVVVDRLYKQRHFAPCTTITAEGLPQLALDHIFKLTACQTPSSLIVDRCSLRASLDLTCYCLGEPRLSAAFHPQTDGQTERTNAPMEEY